MSGPEISGRLLARQAQSARAPAGEEQGLDVLQQDVGLEVDPVARHQLGERRLLQRVRDERRAEPSVLTAEDREAHAVDGYRALLHEIRPDRLRRAEAVEDPLAVGRDGVETAGPVDMAEHHVSAESIAEAQRALEVDARPPPERADRGAPQRLGRDVDGEVPAVARGDGETGAVDGDALAQRQLREAA